VRVPVVDWFSRIKIRQADKLVIVQAPPLYVVTNLTTEGVQGSRRSGQGKRMDPNGFTKYVAAVPSAVMF